jgi:pilus assembly protein CpaB
VRQKDIITLILALSIAFLSALVSKALFERSSQNEKKAQLESSAAENISETKTTEVLVSNQTITIGAPIKSHMMMWQKWPKEAVLDSYLVRNEESEGQYQTLINGLSKRQISRGEPITSHDIIKTGDRSFLAAIVKPGMRAVSLPLGSSAAGSSLLSPGDRLDVISASISAPTFGQSNNFSGTTLVENAKVLAIDRHLGVESKSADTKGIQLATEEGAKFITIEVTPEEAEILSMATKLGELTFSLRGMESVSSKSNFVATKDIKKRLQEQLGKQETAKIDASLAFQNNKVQTVVMRGTEISPLQFLRGRKDGKESWSLLADTKNNSALGPASDMSALSSKESKSPPKKPSKKGDPSPGEEEEESNPSPTFGLDTQKNAAQVNALINRIKSNSNQSINSTS